MKWPRLNMLIASLLFSAVAISGGSTASANAATTVVSDSVCVMNDLVFVVATVTVGQTEATRLTLDIGRDGNCGFVVPLSHTDPKMLGPWRLSISQLDSRGEIIPGTEADYINQTDCPALEPYTNQLREPYLAKKRGGRAATVSVGPIVFRDEGGIFRLESEPDRQTSAKWLRQTLAAVRGCWNNGNPSIPAHFLADRFYAALED
jgi:hypothetical protein